MSAPVGVLAVLERELISLARAAVKAGDFARAIELNEARVAIAKMIAERDELVEALSEARDALTDYDGHISNPDFRGGWDSRVGYDAYQRASAALARVGGAK